MCSPIRRARRRVGGLWVSAFLEIDLFVFGTPDHAHLRTPLPAACTGGGVGAVTCRCDGVRETTDRLFATIVSRMAQLYTGYRVQASVQAGLLSDVSANVN